MSTRDELTALADDVDAAVTIALAVAEGGDPCAAVDELPRIDAAVKRLSAALNAPQAITPITDDMVEARNEGYRLGFEAGKATALEELSADKAIAGLRDMAGPPLPKRAEPKCVCGHAERTHNDLDYCLGKRRLGADGKWESGQWVAGHCGCEHFEPAALTTEDER